MAYCCLFLASDESSIVSGTTLVAWWPGGRTQEQDVPPRIRVTFSHLSAGHSQDLARAI
jgi:hypothetical protein